MSVASPTLAVADLEQLLVAADPGVVLAAPRILRRVIKKHSGLAGPGLQVPHHKSYVLGRDELLAIAGRDELDLPPERELPETVVLLPQPADGKQALLPGAEILHKYLRYLFHAHVHAALQQRRRDGALTEAAVRDRIRRLGLTEFAEAEAVLRQEHFLLPGDETTVYEEFVALFLELRYFAPEKLPLYFPSLDPAATERVIAEDVDVEALVAALRDGPLSQAEALAKGATPTLLTLPAPTRRPADPAMIPVLCARADRAEARGNLVRAARLRLQAGRADAAEQTIGRLLDCLRQALHLTEAEAAGWRRGLLALLWPAARARWPVAARLLFDLQKICVDHARDVYAVDLVEWLVSWGKRPVQRRLPYQADVLTVKHLRVALGRLAGARLDEPTRRDLEGRLHAALHHAEERVRERLRPVIIKTLDSVGMSPESAAEAVSRDKLVEELLDQVTESGFINFGDLRDAIARNRLKMPDLAGPVEFFAGDRLIRVNRRLAESLDGVYRRGEIYLRWLQRLNALAFGTPVGRFLTRYFVLPFGAAYVALEGVQELILIVLKLTGVLPPHHDDSGVHHRHEPPVPLTHWWSVGLLGLFLLGLLYLPRFRRGVVQTVRATAHGFRLLFYDAPRYLFHLPLLQALFQSRLYLLFYQFLGKPLLYSAPVMVALYLLHVRPEITLYAGAAMFLATTLLFNSELGRQLEELTTDGLVRGWHLLSVDVVPGLFRAVADVFKRLLGSVERVIYTVDEWLRFRQGQGRGWFYVKLVLGFVWFLITYVVRFAVNLLIEPQINPIKHFPVVTVSHKMILPLALPPGKGQPSPLGQLVMAVFPVGASRANAIALSFVWGIPGIFGFLVWELKENWKMYRANQSPTLDAEMVGSHGETVLRLLRPGFHSGTLPKLYAKLRRAKGKSLHHHEETLLHVGESVQRFVERTLLATLAGSRRWDLGAAARFTSVRCGCNRIRVELACASLPGATVLLDLEQHAGRLVAGVARRGWLEALTAEQSAAWSAALAGFWKLAGVDVVRERVAARLPAGATFLVTEDGLLVWLGAKEARYDLEEEETLPPIPPQPEFPELPRTEVVFGEVPLYWNDWVATWEADREDKGTPWTNHQ